VHQQQRRHERWWRWWRRRQPAAVAAVWFGIGIIRPLQCTQTEQQPPPPPATCTPSSPKSSSRLPPNCSISQVQRIKMSRRSSEGAVKRSKQQLVEEAEPMLLAVVKSFLDTLVWVQLCNPQGVARFSFVRLPPRVSRPFVHAPVYGMSLQHAERLRTVGCGLKGKLVRMLSLGMIRTTNITTTTATTTTINSTSITITVSTTTAHHTRHVEPQRNWGACHKMMQSNVRRVAAGLASAVRDKVAKEAAELFLKRGRYRAAKAQLQRAIHLGDLPSRALEAWLLIGDLWMITDEMQGELEEQKRGFKLAKQGARFGCHHCQGVMSYCLCWGYGCKRDAARSLELARESSGRGSRYGQFALGELHYWGRGGLAQDHAQAAAFYGLAAAQGLDAAQCLLGHMYQKGHGVSQDFAEALRLFQLAAAQEHPAALFVAACCYENAADHWHSRAVAAGHPGKGP